MSNISNYENAKLYNTCNIFTSASNIFTSKPHLNKKDA